MDLIMKMDISLRESLCGFKKIINTLDDRTLVIQTIPGINRCVGYIYERWRAQIAVAFGGSGGSDAASPQLHNVIR